jgi:small subunit ribosomal protein S1
MMRDSLTPENQVNVERSADAEPSFGDMLSQYEKSHSRKREGGGKQLVGTVVAVSADAIVLDIGFKSEGTLPLADLQASGRAAKPGDKLSVSVRGRDAEGYYQLTLGKVERPTDWAALEKAFADKATIVGTVRA